MIRLFAARLPAPATRASPSSAGARLLWTRTAALWGPKKFDPAAAAGATSSRVGQASSRTRRQQRRAAATASSGRPSGAPPRRSAEQQKTTSGSGAASSSTTSSSASSPSGKRAAKGASQVGRFNRVTAQRGLAFASYLYVIGESMTLGLTYLLHTDTIGVGEVGAWLRYGGLGGLVDGYLERGPTVFGVRLSPRLFLNYLLANVVTYPLYTYQYAFCLATAPVIGRATAPIRGALRNFTRSKKKSIPKAPAPTGQA